jgi:hypothetical protein
MKPQIPDNPAAAPPLSCIQCIPWFQQKPQTTQNTRKAQQTSPFLSLFLFVPCIFVANFFSQSVSIRVYPWFFPSGSPAPICVNLRFQHFISFPEFQMPF